MCMRFFYPKKGPVKQAGIVNEKAEKAAIFAAVEPMYELYDYRPKIGDGMEGGGTVLYDSGWGKRALDLANEVLLEFGEEFMLYAFHTTPNEWILLRIESLSHKYGYPSVKMLHSYFVKYRKRLVKDSASGILPDDLGVEVACPGLRRLLKVPDDLSRFKNVPLRISYIEHGEEHFCVVFLCCVEKEQGYCVWTSSDFHPERKDRPIKRKEQWTLKLPFEAHRSVSFFVET